MFDVISNNKWIFKFTIKLKKKLYINFILSLIKSIVDIIFPILIGAIINSAFNLKDNKLFIKYIIVYFVVFVFYESIKFFISISTKNLCEIFFCDLKRNIFNRFLKFRAKILKNINTGDMINVLNQDVDNVFNFFLKSLMVTLVAITQIICTAIIITMYNFKLSIILLIFSFLSISISNIFKKNFVLVQKKLRLKRGEYLGWLMEVLKGNSDIRFNQSEKMFENIFERYIKQILFLKERTRFLEVKAERFNSFCTGVFTLVFWSILAFMVIKGEINIGMFYIIDKYFNLNIQNINKILEERINSQSYQPSFSKLKTLYNMNYENINTKNINVDLKNQDIKFENVKFKYNKNLVLKNLNYTFESGKIIGIVGKNGIGKTTLFEIIACFFEIEDGKIYIGENNILDLSLKNIRSSIAYVEQHTNIFYGSIKENLQLINHNITEKEILDILEVCNLKKKILSFKDGINEDLKYGNILSDGEKQRFSIAMSLAKQADIILMDEPTAFLDEKNEILILNNIKRLLKNKIVIIISHKIETIKMVDEVVLLDQGKILSFGKHEYLYSNNDTYRKLFTNQI